MAVAFIFLLFSLGKHHGAPLQVLQVFDLTSMVMVWIEVCYVELSLGEFGALQIA